MKLENFLMSKNKWEPIVALLEKPGPVDWEKIKGLMYEVCGHCKEFTRSSICWDCGACTLLKAKVCKAPATNNRDTDYWKLHSMAYNDGSIKRNKRKALQIVKRIYAAILKDDPRNKND